MCLVSSLVAPVFFGFVRCQGVPEGKYQRDIGEHFKAFEHLIVYLSSYPVMCLHLPDVMFTTGVFGGSLILPPPFSFSSFPRL